MTVCRSCLGGGAREKKNPDAPGLVKCIFCDGTVRRQDWSASDQDAKAV